MFCGNDKTLKWEQDGQHVSLCDRKCSTEGVVVEETSVNPRHRLFLTLRIRNYEAYTLYASYLGRNVWENHVFKMGGKKPPQGDRKFFGQRTERIVHRTVACLIDFCYHSIQKRK